MAKIMLNLLICSCFKCLYNDLNIIGINQLLKHMTSLMVDARSHQHGMMGNPDTSQLLLIVSDGRGLFMEGMETVKTAVRQAREANIFLVFVIIDNPQCRVCTYILNNLRICCSMHFKILNNLFSFHYWYKL